MKKFAGIIILVLIFLLMLLLIYWYYEQKIVEIDKKLSTAAFAIRETTT